MSYEVRCADAGASSCGGRVTAASEEELRAKLAQHLKERHGVDEPNETIMDHLVAVSRQR
jgi:predicted small metal-binding protein